MWLPSPALWNYIFGTALVSTAFVLLLEMLPGRPSVFLVALGAGLIELAVVAML